MLIMTWLEFRREVLIENIEHNRNTLSRLEQKDTSGLDDFNQNHYDNTIKRLLDRIKQDEEELDML